MNSILIERAKNGWIVKTEAKYSPHWLGGGPPNCVPDTSSFMVFRTIEELAKELPSIVSEPPPNATNL